MILKCCYDLKVNIGDVFCCTAAVQTALKFTYSEKYPDEVPLFELLSQDNLEDNDVTDIMKLLQDQVSI